MRHPDHPAPVSSELVTDDQNNLAHGRASEEPPVVARVLVEIRSDGSRTIARGAMEDLLTGQRVAIEAAGTTPLDVAISLAKSMRQLPSFVQRSVAAQLELVADTGQPRLRRRDALRQKALDLLSKIK